MFSFIAPEERLNVITHAIGVLLSVIITFYFFNLSIITFATTFGSILLIL